MSNETNADEDDLTAFQPNATVTLPDGSTKTVSDFTITKSDGSIDYTDAQMDTVSIGLQAEDREYDFQATLEVPTKTLVCVNCGHPNVVPAWAFVNVSFRGELEPLSGEYAVGHQCHQCGFPY